MKVKQFSIIIAALLLAVITTPAQAMYHAGMGKFMQRDPLNQNRPGGGYHDGMNLYQYVKSDPIGGLDPTGTVIVTDCPIKKHLDSKGVSSFEKRSGGKYRYAIGTFSVLRPLEAEIYSRMLNSKEEFDIKGNTAKDEVANLVKHIETRIKMIEYAKGLQKVAFARGMNIKMNLKYWRISGDKDGAPEWSVRMPGRFPNKKAGTDYVDKVINDVLANSHLYAMSCAMAMGLIEHVGHPIDVYNTNAQYEWIPGDVGFVRNTKFKGTGADVTQGENIIYMGDSVFYGHFPKNKGKRLVTLHTPVSSDGAGVWLR